MEKESDEGGNLNKLITLFEPVLGDDVYWIMALYATTKFKEFFVKAYDYVYNEPIESREFLFSDECVAYEIKEHVIGYRYAIGDSEEKTDVTNAMLVFCFGSKSKLQDRCKEVDISEQDVVGKMNIFKNVLPFHYYDGIRDCYLYTNADPYRVDDHTREFKEPSLNWANNKISV